MAVGEALHLRELLGRDRLVVREVEAQPIGRDERTRLLHVRPEHLAHCPVQDVGRGVIAPYAVAPHVDVRGFHLVTLGEARHCTRLVHGETGQAVAGVAHVEDGAERR